MGNKKKLLMLVPYSVSGMDAAPKIRAYHMYHALKDEIPTVLIEGKEYRRMLAEAGSILKNEAISYVYIEAMAASLRFCDRFFLDLLKVKKVMIFPFIRDLYWRYFDTPQPEKPTTGIGKWWAGLGARMNLYDEPELNYYLRNATALLFPSRLLAETVDFPEKHTLMPGGDPLRCRRRKLPEKKNIVFVGGISHLKAEIDLLINAMAIVVKHYPDAHCTIVGYGEAELLDTLRDKHHITFLEGRNYWDIPIIMTDAYVSVLPRHRTPYNEISLPLKLLDYMSCGRPVVATNCNTIADFISENEVGIITDDSPQSFASGIMKLINDRDLATKYGSNALLAVNKRHSWKHRARQLIQIMQTYR